MQILEHTLPGLTRQRTARLIAVLSDRTCGEGCWRAKEDVCRCECGGRNHGIHLTGSNGIRACRISGRRYGLLAVGTHSDLLSQVEDLCRADNIANGRMRIENGEYQAFGHSGGWFATKYVHPTEYNTTGTYVLKYASLPQCLKWNELEYFGVADDRDRYHAGAAILWKGYTVLSIKNAPGRCYEQIAAILQLYIH